ncbi:MAG: alpha/beta fold hydrolase [Okeania sp. SIO3B5]|uniref:alpha/beta hydrolase n=1 Tax=Okeania sp. SIO3B5 TaxID=2607811 RepID=UPI001400F379|nr:alpha/beta hydrolase [Okeania sp. SIO3B5]NEO57168.1 alpha/beta fold hydrolase [Okeania sp. SIO3B5]
MIMIPKSLYKWQFNFLILSIVSTLLIALPAYSAEKITLIYAIFHNSIPVKSLEEFSQNGTVDKHLSVYFNFLNPKQQDQFRAFLNNRYSVQTSALNQLGQSYAGKQLLTVLGKGIKIPGGKNGDDAIRDSIIQASTTPEGVSLINVIRHFPADMQVDVNYFLQSINYITTLAQKTQTFIKYLPTSAKNKSTSVTTNLPNLAQEKLLPSQINKRILSLYDTSRDRQLKVAFYLPRTTQKNLPVIIISNGLGARLERFDQLANHLASYGFSVIIPDHPQSNHQRKIAFYKGLYSDPFNATEFIDRPLDITFILDRFEELNQTQFNQKLNLKKVGIFGYSFGGATAFALGGAKINFKQLKKDCQSPNGFHNISILYQCRALELPPKSYDLKDNRIQAIFAFFPFCRSLYGASEMNQVNVPVLWQATDTDFITPLLTEQVFPFSWLKSSEKYLAISEKLPHSRSILKAMSQLSNQNITEEQVVEATRYYLNILTVAFFNVYIAEDDFYRSYLNPDYTLSISKAPFKLHLIQNINFIYQSKLFKFFK